MKDCQKCNAPGCAENPCALANAFGDVVLSALYTNANDVATETYAYDCFGRKTLTVNALGDEAQTAYDANGNVVSEEGATYPVRYAYDSQNRRVAMWTNRSGDEWDMTRWAYDPATGLCTSKTYSDGSVTTYEYTPDGLLETTRYASGHWVRNIYNEARQIVGVLYDSAADVSYSRDVFGRELSAVNAIAAYSYSPDDNGLATNETVTITDVAHGLSRIADNDGRLIAFDAGEGYAAQTITYRPDGKIAAISTADAVVSYTYGEGGLETGYSLSVVGGATFTRTVLRDPFRRGMILDVQNSIGQGYGYTYDALSRPVTRNADTFAYNFRSEVIGANVAGQSESYDYDNIGNSTFAAVNSVTNIYAANGLNQYVSVASDEGVVEPAYDEDGNMVAYGPWSYAYDSVGRLTTASSNGLIVATNYYDHQGRRIRLVTQTAAHTFIYDGWNVVLELVEHDGVTDRIEYYWGRDLSGTLQGAGGVGGLLYLKINGTVYVPIYDANGNVMEYRTADGSLAAAYVYDSFGRTFSQTGSLADVFRFGYSTKSFERETGLYYYGKRFYLVRLRRWLNRDPIEEKGGILLYAFNKNAALFHIDQLGDQVFVYKHCPTLEPPGGWTTPNSKAESVYPPQTYSVSENDIVGGKLSFSVNIIPDDVLVHVYFKTGQSVIWAMNFENDHIAIVRRRDRALHIFKNAVEAIFDCPKLARKQKDDLVKNLQNQLKQLAAEDAALDAPGGPHDLQNNTPFDF